MRRLRPFAVMLLIATLLVLLCGCSKKGDESKTDAQANSKSNNDGVLLKDVLTLWQAGNKDDTVKQFLMISWNDPSVFQGIPALDVSEQQFITLSTDERNNIQQEAMDLTANLRRILMAVLAAGDAYAATSDIENAKKCHDAVMACGHALSASEHLVTVQMVGKAITNEASQSASQ